MSFRLAALLLLVAAAVVAACGVQTVGADSPEVRFSRLGAAHGLRQYVSNAWGVVAVDVTNSGDKPAEVLATFNDSRNPAEQYARLIRTPPHSQRRSWVPVRMPDVPTGVGRVELNSLLIDRSSGAEVVMRRDGEVLRHSIYLSVNHDKPMAGFISAPHERQEPDTLDYGYEALIGLQGARGMERRVATIGDRHLPTLPEAYDGLDVLVLNNNRFAEDVAAMAAIRAWLSDGGHIWILLDQVDFEGVERLLGEAFSCQLVDRVELNNVLIESVSPVESTEYSPPVEYEEPVDLVRVIVSDMDVTHTVNNWPAAFVRNVGRGQVVFTTVGAKAWVRRSGPNGGRWDPHRSTDYEPIEQLQELPIVLGRRRMALESAKVIPHLTEQIGYRIVSRTRVSVILAAFCVGLFVAGLVLARRRHLEHMGWIAPAFALLAAVPLIWLGIQSQQTVPPTIGQVQLVEVADVADQITTTGVMALYRPKSDFASLGAREGGVLLPDAAAVQNTTRRMVWTDMDQWHWENLRLSAGVRIARFQRSATLTEPVQAVGTFTEAGFEGRLTGALESCGDAVIAIPAQPRLAAEIEHGTVKASSANILAPGQYIASGLLSDEQRRRQSIYRQLLRESHNEQDLITRPTLFAWTNSVDMRFELPENVRQVGSALWTVPLELEPPESGARVVIPSPFVPYRPVKGPSGEGVSPLYNHRTGEWVDSKLDSRTWLRFQIPRGVLPLKLDRARLTLDITAPSRTLQIVGFAGGQNKTVFARTSPIGRIPVDITDPSILELDENGGFRLGILVAASTDASGRKARANWVINSLQLEVAGEAL